MSLIAKKSGVSTGSIYHYFDSKEAIINELYRGIVRYNGQRVLEGFFTDEPIRTRLERAWEQLIRVSLEYPQGFQFIEQYSFSPYIRQEVKQESYSGGWCGPMDKLYADAIREKLFRADIDPHVMVQMHYGSLLYAVKGAMNRQWTVSDELIEQLIQSCWNSVALKETG
ncbi:TetR/AcrR family transcriptional regulator [Paenibacillus filicis]|uniref:TetR/AcrR family transcriptional regulator n=1 Tax=Paenibacillus filicis TaxID=669464 RepID=A0ABU9DFP3_9BACL